jgi:aspartokinase-like uncharacterized kinase|tara:strand:+ start:2036 stop:2617 length:582 start_codon:yes stop_codon:yes gene_type:complete
LPVIVLKLGGSLMQSEELFFWLDNIFSRPKESICIVVPGGGKFAEHIRVSQKHFNFSDEVAHKMALLAMSQYGYFLTGINKNINIIKNIKKIYENKNKNSFLWLPDNSLENNIELPQTWDFTSDSIALWLATFLQADKLIMVKSKKIIFNRSNIDDHINKNDIDKGFKELIDMYKGELIFLEKKQYNKLKEIM